MSVQSRHALNTYLPVKSLFRLLSVYTLLPISNLAVIILLTSSEPPSPSPQHTQTVQMDRDSAVPGG